MQLQRKPKPIYSVRTKDGDIVCNCPKFLLESIQQGNKVRQLDWIRQPWETGKIVTIQDLEN